MEATNLHSSVLRHSERCFDTWCIAPGVVPNWSMRDLYDEDGVERNPVLASAIGDELARRSVHLAFGPSVAPMCGEVVEQSVLRNRVRLPPHKLLLRRDRNVPSEGTWLERAGEAGVMTMAGCLALVAQGGGKLLFAHAGFSSLVDKQLIAGHGASRLHESVVYAIADAFRARRVPLETVTLGGYFSIPPERYVFDMDTGAHAEFNQALYAYGRDRWGGAPFEHAKQSGNRFNMNLPLLVSVQADCAGFGGVEISFTLPESGPFAYTQHPDTSLRGAIRNLVIVRRN
jgi:hypothetical protein